MASLEIPVRSLAVEWRFLPNLSIYSTMDQVGIEFKEQYADWKRTPLTLELQDKRRRRRFVMAFNRCFYHVINSSGSSVSQEIDRAIRLFESVVKGIQISSLSRIGLRQWAAFPRSEPIRELVRIVDHAFHSQANNMAGVLDGRIDDLAYVVDVNHKEGWKYSLKLGPMLKSQWFEVVPHDEVTFESKDEFREYKDAFPERFMYIDMDASKEDVLFSDSKSLLRSFRSGTHNIIAALNDQLK